MTESSGRLGKYELRGTLGRGAMGVVYDGWDPVIARRVAIKTVKVPDASDAEAMEELARFRREAQAAGRLTHPNIVGVYDYGEDGNIAYIVMEFVDGPTLKSLLEKQERMAMPDILRVMEDLLTGLAFSHARGIVHRDIKPANIMLTSDGRAKIADFGIARIESSSMTQAGTVMGTPAYMSPEQFMGQTVDARTDLYSSGVLLYQLLTGERPFEGGMTAIMHKALNTEPPKPSELSVTAPPAMDSVVARAMAKRPEARFANAEAFASAMRAAAAGAPAADAESDATMVSAPPRAAAPPPRPAAPPPPAPKPGKAGAPVVPIAAGVALLLAAGGGAWFMFGRDGAPPPPAPTSPQLAVAPVTPTLLPPPATPDAAPAPVTTQPAPPAPVTPPPTFVPAPQAAQVTPAPQAAPAPVLVTPSQPPAPSPAPTAPQPRPAPPAIVAPASSPAPVITQPAPVAPPPPPSVAQPAPAPPQTLALAPVTPPPPQPQPQPAALPSAANIRAALAAALPPVACSLVSGSAAADRVTLRGVVSRGAPERALRDAVANAAGTVPRDWRVNSFDGPFCAALDAIRPAAQAFGSPGALTVSLTSNQTRLRDGELVTVSLTGPDFPAYLMVSFLVHDGTLAHLHPTPTDPARQLQPGATLRLGDPSIGGPAWAVSPPYGTDIIIAVASSVPLFDKPRPDDEDTAAYLRDLRAAIENARRRGARLAADAWVLETVAR